MQPTASQSPMAGVGPATQAFIEKQMAKRGGPAMPQSAAPPMPMPPPSAATMPMPMDQQGPAVPGDMQQDPMLAGGDPMVGAMLQGGPQGAMPAEGGGVEDIIMQLLQQAQSAGIPPEQALPIILKQLGLDPGAGIGGPPMEDAMPPQQIGGTWPY